VEAEGEDVMTTRQQNQGVGEIALKPTFRSVDGVSIRFVESAPASTDALLLSPKALCATNQHGRERLDARF